MPEGRDRLRPVWRGRQVWPGGDRPGSGGGCTRACWKGSTTRSRYSSGWPTATATTSTSSSRSGRHSPETGHEPYSWPGWAYAARCIYPGERAKGGGRRWIAADGPLPPPPGRRGRRESNCRRISPAAGGPDGRGTSGGPRAGAGDDGPIARPATIARVDPTRAPRAHRPLGPRPPQAAVRGVRWGTGQCPACRTGPSGRCRRPAGAGPFG